MTRALNEDELRVLAALDGEFVSTSVVKIRAGYSCSASNGGVFNACVELARRGLAERTGADTRSKPRWRRSLSLMPGTGTTPGAGRTQHRSIQADRSPALEDRAAGRWERTEV